MEIVYNDEGAFDKRLQISLVLGSRWSVSSRTERMIDYTVCTVATYNIVYTKLQGIDLERQKH